MAPYSDSAAAAAALVVFALFVIFFAVIAYVVTALFLMRIFDKAGVQGRWRAWVPVYNFVVFAKLGDVSPWVALIAIGAAVLLGQIPGVGWIFRLLPLAVTALAAWRVGQKLQKPGAGWLVLYVLVSPVWLGINAFDKSRWNPNIPPSAWATNSFFADRTIWQGIPVQPNAGYAAPPAGYQPPAGSQPPAGYQPPAPPAGYQPPAPPAGSQPPAASPSPYSPPPAAAPIPPVTPEPPASPEPPAPGAPQV